MSAEKPGASPDGGGPVRRWFTRPWVTALAVVCVLLLILMFQNLKATTYELFFWTVSVSRVLALLAAFMGGAAAGALAFAAFRKRR